jgi:putative oxygen-independent coproporphyrinogen III oxidase
MKMSGEPPRLREVSLYFHLPFCTRKCGYCHFYVIPDREELKQRFMEGLRLEWERQRPLLEDCSLVSIYFGGGTPALLGPERIGQILEWVSPSSCEITLEANPENITSDLISRFADAGINRISIGLQAVQTPLLHTLGRLHTGESALSSVRAAFGGGIHNISVDLMYDLPGQSLADWQATLDSVVKLPITHLSLYNLAIESHTSFDKRRAEIERQMPTEEHSIQMLDMAVERLSRAGLERYEISAWAKPGYPSRHNLGYWLGRPFLGLGPSAFSDWEGRRFRNIANLNRWWRALKEGSEIVDFEERLEPAARARELLAIGLRMLDGVRMPDHSQPAIEGLITQGLLQSIGNRICLTERGRLFYDSVAIALI